MIARLLLSCLVGVTVVNCRIIIPQSTLSLEGGSGPHEGNIRIHLKGKLGFICPNHWGMRDAKVACRQLNYARALNFTTKSFIEYDNSTKIFYWLDSVQCKGGESDVNFCWHRKYGKHNCRHRSAIAGVICSNETEHVVTKPVPSKSSGSEGAELEVRLNGPSKHGFISKGYLEVNYDGVWGAVCADRWTSTESYVACGNLGYPDVDDEKDNSATPEKPMDTNHYWMRHVKCNGTESTLYECKHAGWRRHICKSGKPVYLKCKRSHLLRENRYSKAAISQHDARLRAGSVHSEGRVEIFHKERWGTICHDKWSIRNANVFCRQMGFGTAFEAMHHAYFGQAMGKVWLDEVQCKGDEKDIRNCSRSEWSDVDCGHREDAGVKCHPPYGKPEQAIRIVGGTNMSGRVEIKSNGKWEGICGIGWGIHEAQVVCRQAGLGYPKRGFSTSGFGVTKSFHMHTVKCSGDELAIHHCHHQKMSEKAKDCGVFMASVVCSRTAPDLVTDYKRMKRSILVQTKSLYELTCAYEEGCLASDATNYIQNPHYFDRTLLRFTSRMFNRGTGDFRPFKSQDKWEWHDCHQHYHSMERFSDYDLTNLKYKELMAEGHKASFCLEDSICDRGVNQSYSCKNDGEQGISVGCADNYKWDIDCQWIDITNVQFGMYRLRVILNPLRKVFESDYTNNIVSCNFQYKDFTTVIVDKCYIEPCEQMSHGGTANGACCKFPFIYKGKEYHSCTTFGFKNRDKLWCATTSNYDKDKLYGLCS